MSDPGRQDPGAGFCYLACRVGEEDVFEEARLYEQALKARTVAVADARRYVRDRLDGLLSSEKLAEAELLTSELVTNAVRHARLKDGDPIAFEVHVDADTVHVAVVDDGAGFDFSKIFEEPRDPLGGWRLFVVGRVSDRWGIASHPHTVWFEIDR
jgi:anti-sigma regulatory factor (Ser/Thr protein kinase)